MWHLLWSIEPTPHTMNLISKKHHGLLDYFVGALLIASPWLCGFYNDGLQSFLPIALGFVTIGYSMITKYEYSVAQVLPFSFHLLLDTIAGILLAASPWIFDFNTTVYIPHLVIGLLQVGAVLLTDERFLNSRKRKKNKPRTTQLLYTPWME
jgi:hypothetical protein